MTFCKEQIDTEHDEMEKQALFLCIWCQLVCELGLLDTELEQKCGFGTTVQLKSTSQNAMGMLISLTRWYFNANPSTPLVSQEDCKQPDLLSIGRNMWNLLSNEERLKMRL